MSHPPANPIPEKPPIGLYGGEILFAAPRPWDETCFATPALRAIRAARPSCTLGVICHEEQADYWSSIAGINAIVAYDNRTKLRDMLRAHGESPHSWDAAILWEKDLAAEFCRSLGVKQRLGYALKPLTKFLTDAIPTDHTPSPVRHRVQYYLDLMEALKIPTRLAEIFSPSSMHHDRKAKHVVVSPDSDFGPSHEWTFTGWEKTIEWLGNKGFSEITLLSASMEKNPLSSQLAQRFPSCRTERIANAAESLPLLASAGFAICADSSICHLSAHVGTATLTLFGPNDPDWRRPLGKQHIVVREKVECSPCLMRKCLLDRRCQNELTAAKVIAAFEELWQREAT
jgi:heptosyltransferase-2